MDRIHLPYAPIMGTNNIREAVTDTPRERRPATKRIGMRSLEIGTLIHKLATLVEKED